MAMENLRVNVSAIGTTIGAPPSWNAGSNGAYNNNGASVFVREGGTAELTLQLTPMDNYEVGIQDAADVFWFGLNTYTMEELLSGINIEFSSGGSTQLANVLVVEVNAAAITVAKVLSLSRMPAAQKKLVEYGLATAEATNSTALRSAATVYQETIQQINEPSSRTAVLIQKAKDDAAALKKEIRKAVKPVAPKAKVKKPVILSKDAPSFQLELGSGKLKIKSLKGSPKNATEKWFEVQILDSIADDDGEGIEEAITRTGASIDTSSLGGKTVWVRGRWVWKQNGLLVYGPYTGWTKIRLQGGSEEE